MTGTDDCYPNGPAVMGVMASPPPGGDSTFRQRRHSSTFSSVWATTFQAWPKIQQYTLFVFMRHGRQVPR